MTRKLQTPLALFLTLALLLAACGSKATPTAAPPSGATQASGGGAAQPVPTQPPAPTGTPVVELGKEQRSEEGGFAFKAIPGYDVNALGGLVMLAPAGTVPDEQTGPLVIITGGPNRQDVNPADALSELPERFGADAQVTLGPLTDVKVGGAPGKAVDLSGTVNGVEVLGRAIVVVTGPGGQGLAAYALAPTAEWEKLGPAFAAVTNSITLFEPLAKLEMDPGWYIYTNANDLRAVAVHDGQLFAAGVGGVVVWDTALATGAKYTTLDGLSHISTYDVVACDIPDPTIVVGTQRGLSFFDQTMQEWDATQITPEDSRVGVLKIYELYCDQANNRLLISYEGGLGVYDIKTGEFKKFGSSDGLLTSAPGSIVVADKDIWAGDYNGLVRISGDKVAATFNAASGMPNETVRALAASKDGAVWVGTPSGLLRFKNNQWKLYDSNAGVPGEISSLTIDDKGIVWLTTYPFGTGRVVKFDPKAEKGEVVFEYPKDGIFDLALGEGGRIYIATPQGVKVIENGAATDWNTFDWLASNFVDAIETDKNGILWIGMGGGMQSLDPAHVDEFQSTYRSGEGNAPGGNWARDFAMSADGTVAVAVVNGSFSTFKDGQWTQFKDYYSHDLVEYDSAGRLWLSDEGYGVVILDGDQATKLTTAEGLPSDYVYSLLADGDGMWIGTGDGLLRWENGQLETIFTKDDPQLPSDTILQIVKERSGAYLLASYSALVRYDGKEVKVLLQGQYDDPTFDVFTSITQVGETRGGRIWVGTSNGLLYTDDDGGIWTKLTTADGLPTNLITALHVDEYGTLWIGGGDSFNGGGLARYVPVESTNRK